MLKAVQPLARFTERATVAKDCRMNWGREHQSPGKSVETAEVRSKRLRPDHQDFVQIARKSIAIAFKNRYIS